MTLRAHISLQRTIIYTENECSMLKGCELIEIYYCRIFKFSTAWNLIIMLIYAHRDVIISDVSHNKTNQLKDNFILIKNIYGYMGLN